MGLNQILEFYMAFFSPEKLKHRDIVVDEMQVSSDSPEVQKRLERIEQNYQELDSILSDLETKMSSDERLKAIDEATAEGFEETFGVKRKRKWRSPKPKKKSRSRSRSSADPRKPR
jgi:uncharacterized protein YpiB (UPF0302 family)